MNSNNQKIIFLNSYLPRTGHNFTSEVLKIFSDHQVLAHNRSETRISTILESYYKIRDRNFYESDRKFLNSLFVDDLRKKIVIQTENRYVMIKDTSFVGVDLLPKIFPNDLHFLLIRDPLKVYLSLVKAMNLSKNSWKNRIKKLGIPAGFYPYTYSRKLSEQVLKTLPDNGIHTVIRYEDLVRKEESVLLTLKKKFGTDKSLKQIKKEIEEIEVINTSFYKEVNATNIWDIKPKTDTFDPIERKGSSFLVRKGIELGSRKLRKKLNYI